MFEKVNPEHPDKVADRIAGAIVDIFMAIDENIRVAVEVLLGHGHGYIIVETSSKVIPRSEMEQAAFRIADLEDCIIKVVNQDEHLSENQRDGVRCGDNGIFRGVPVTEEQKQLTEVAKYLYGLTNADGKYILADDKMTICQSNATEESLAWALKGNLKGVEVCRINPLGYWTGGIDVDAGATNRKLGSDMGDSITGGGLHGKDLTKADVSVNIYAFLKAQETGMPVELHCSIGDAFIDGRPYCEIVDIARNYIKSLGGFEKFAEWGLIR